jgi:class 3 adenylate cyclase
LAAFDMRNVRRMEAVYSLVLSFAVVMVLMVMSVILGRDTAVITEVIVSPLTQLAQDMDRVSRFDLTNRRRSLSGAKAKSRHAKQLVKSIDAEDKSHGVADENGGSSIAEVRSIQQSFSTMRTTIQSFAKYVPQDVVYQLVRAKHGLADLTVQEREVTVLFSDIENFTKICECLGVGDKLLNLMSDYFTAMAEIIKSTGGCLLEFIGDAVLAVWNAPNPEEMHAVLAVTAALEMHAFLQNVAHEWDKKGYPRVRIRCGIHTAKVLVGNIGAPNRMKYGLLGDGVNTASRLEETNKRYATRTLISEETWQKVRRQMGSAGNPNNGNRVGATPKAATASSSSGDAAAVAATASSALHGNLTPSSSSSFHSFGTRDLFQHRPVDRVVFKGKTRATTLYEIVDFAGDRKPDSVINNTAAASSKAPKKSSASAATIFSNDDDGASPASNSKDRKRPVALKLEDVDEEVTTISGAAQKLIGESQKVITNNSANPEQFSDIVKRVRSIQQLKVGASKSFLSE